VVLDLSRVFISVSVRFLWLGVQGSGFWVLGSKKVSARIN
jgi:hypothetical protein